MAGMSQHSQHEAKAQRALCTAKDVSNYLRQNISFFNDHPDVLSELSIPHATGGAVSLIERQVEVLRRENKQLRTRIRDLVEIAKENDHLLARMHRLSVDLISAQDLDELLDTIYDRLRHDFSADFAAIRLIGDYTGMATHRVEFVSSSHEGLMLFDNILLRRKPVCGRFNSHQLNFLFGESAAAIGSMALVPFFSGASSGFFVIASRSPDRFKAGMSTVFLSYLGDIVSATLQRFTQK